MLRLVEVLFAGNTVLYARLAAIRGDQGVAPAAAHDDPSGRST